MPMSNHTKQILIGNFKTQSYVLCTAFFCSQVSKTTWNFLNCYVNLTNRFHVAVRLFSSRFQLTTKCGKTKKVQNHVPRTSQSLQAVIGSLQFSWYHWNLKNLTLHSYLTLLSYKSLEIFSACTVLSHGSIMLPHHQPRVFARLACWQ